MLTSLRSILPMYFYLYLLVVLVDLVTRLYHGAFDVNLYPIVLLKIHPDILMALNKVDNVAEFTTNINITKAIVGNRPNK